MTHKCDKIVKGKGRMENVGGNSVKNAEQDIFRGRVEGTPMPGPPGGRLGVAREAADAAPLDARGVVLREEPPLPVLLTPGHAAAANNTNPPPSSPPHSPRPHYWATFMGALPLVRGISGRAFWPGYVGGGVSQTRLLRSGPPDHLPPPRPHPPPPQPDYPLGGSRNGWLLPGGVIGGVYRSWAFYKVGHGLFKPRGHATAAGMNNLPLP